MTNQAWLIKEAISEALSQLQTASQANPHKLEAELLLCHCLGVTRSYLLTWPEKPLADSESKAFFNLVQRRLNGEPIAYILGTREFWGLALAVSPATLIPRADTETLVEAALNKVRQQPEPRILDLGTGSGAIALALAHERPDAQVTAVDYSTDALDIARQNAERHQLKVGMLQSNWYSTLAEQRFDCIVSNPPYIEQHDPHLSQGDLRFEPASALSAGQDGLTDLRQIIAQAPMFLNNQAWLLVEHGYNQTDAVQTLFKQAGFCAITSLQDLAGQPRVTLGQKP
ncbi:peptide chain release factor N(5)-glutamine methyltransferase [Thiomicrospira sp. R3]|uniref:peptide chain release factor N(5)-glutamine methyltransferase n=1 Tax=Thiomicrospira sp. R3 TaxID=3035472 RepID=UPI00259B8690|nr:peptide chain release factor N(5)-glutamine methyltransferase [Thiomicrospira sp. R3]WFE68541.1 peptide chain release factor N(5)-glutamine methyltransferase [Thiomicrospira sp. R3]